ncbi:FAD-dependent oxidoreductase [Rhodococcus aerolatus]
MRNPSVVIVGAGIVGCSLADELTARGWTDVTVLDRGPLPLTGGSSSHAPGLVFQTNPSRTMAHLARYTATKLGALGVDGRPCFTPVGGLEVATTPERWADLHRKHGWAQAWGIPAELVDAADAAARHPLLEADRILGALHTPTDGLADAPAACEAQARRATARGARFVGEQEVLDVVHAGGRVTGVRTAEGVVPADLVVCAAGFWGAELGRRLGMTVPLTPMAHQYATTTPVPALAGTPGTHGGGLPIVRHQDRDLYYRVHEGDRVGIGSYAHRPMPVAAADLDGTGTAMPSMMDFTPDDFAPSWSDAVGLLPRLGESRVDGAFNGIFSFTPDGAPVIGEHRDVAGLWVAEAVWVTHSAGIARAVAEWLVDGAPGVDLREAELYRFADAELAPEVVLARSTRSFVEVYDVLHPLDPPAEPRNLRVSPFHSRQVALGAVFGVGAGWERPLWFEANADLPAGAPERDEWAARNWSPTVVAEARACREAVGLVDMTALQRLEVSGPGALALLTASTSNALDKPVGSVTYTLLLDAAGGVRSDLTVTRLAADRFQVGVNSPRDLEQLRRAAPAGTTVRDVTGATCCLGLWGPAARDVLAPLTPADVSHTGLRYFRAVETTVAGVPVLLQRVSYVGELGWEVYAAAEAGPRLWDALWEVGRGHGLRAVGRGAVETLRIEKGYANASHELTPEQGPAAHGLDFAVRAAERTGVAPERRLVTLTLDDASAVVLGHEPVRRGDTACGYVTSAAWSPTVGRCVALAWVPAACAEPGTALAVEYFGKQLGATVAATPLVDPDMTRIRR